MIARRLAVSVMLFSAVSIAPALRAAPPATNPAAVSTEPGSAVEVREGDVWSKATVVKREGRRIQIRYDDGTEEWVTADRIRAVGTTGDAAEAKPKPAAPKPEVFKVGQAVEVTDNGRWKNATVKNKEGDLYLIAYEGWDKQFFWEWVTDDRVRVPGSAKEGPDAFEQIGEKLGNSNAAQALAEFKKKVPEYRKRRAAEASAESRGESPKKNDPFAPLPFPHPVSSLDVSAVKKVDLSAIVSGAWTYKPGAAATVPAPQFPATELKGGTKSFAERIEAFHVNGPWALLTYKVDFSDTKQVTLEVASTTGDRIAFNGPVDFATIPLAITSDGKRVLGRANGFHSGTMQRLDAWEIAGKELKHIVSFNAFAGADEFFKDIDSLQLAGDQYAIVSNFGGAIACIDYASAKAIWRASRDKGGRPALAVSPDSRSVAVASNGHVLFLDVATGKAIAAIEDSNALGLNRLAFSPDGKRLFGVGQSTLRSWDLATGTPEAVVALPTALSGAPLTAVSSDLVLLGDTLWHVVAMKPIAKLAPKHDKRTFAGGRLWAIAGARGRDEPKTLRGWTLAGDVLAPLVRGAQPGPTLKIAAGARVSIEVNVEGTVARQNAIIEHLKRQVESRGARVDAAGPIKIIVRTEDGKSEQRTYEAFGGGPGGREQQTVTVTEKITRVILEQDGKQLWQTSITATAGHFVNRGEGQSIDDAVRESNKHNLSFVDSVVLPTVIPLDVELDAVPALTLANGGLKVDR